VKARITLSRITPPPGDDRVKFQGEIVIPYPPSPQLNPVANGMRVLVTTATGATVIDATASGGAYNPGTGTGWSTSPSSWTYRSPSVITRGQPQPVPSKSGHYRFRVEARNGSFAVPQAGLPLTGVLVLDPPTAETGQCGTARYPGAPGPACSLNRSGSTLKCR
jgi:hypothetical protein